MARLEKQISGAIEMGVNGIFLSKLFGSKKGMLICLLLLGLGAYLGYRFCLRLVTPELPQVQPPNASYVWILMYGTWAVVILALIWFRDPYSHKGAFYVTAPAMAIGFCYFSMNVVRGAFGHPMSINDYGEMVKYVVLVIVYFAGVRLWPIPESAFYEPQQPTIKQVNRPPARQLTPPPVGYSRRSRVIVGSQGRSTGNQPPIRRNYD